jgi:CO/xanthine dehydrogenase Mo-binding subunit
VTGYERPRPSLTRNPRLGDWITIGRDGRVLVRSGKVELGQGVLTALAQIVADELDVDLARVVMVPARTDRSPDERYTAGSMSVQHSGDALRAVCARVRAIYLAEAAEELARPPATLSVVDGEIRADYGGRTSYWALADDAFLDVDATDTVEAAAKAPEAYTTVGRAQPRLDGSDKILGRGGFIHDLHLDGQLYGRVVRPPARVATLVAVDTAAVAATPGVVAVVHDGSFLGVLAEREEVAVRAAEALRRASRWDEADSLPDEAQLAEFLVRAPAEETVIADSTGPAAGTDPAAAPVARTVTRRFSRGYVAHASLAPSCGLARWDGDRLRVWSHTQGVYPLRTELARSFELPEDHVVVEHTDGAGCYGHNGADDAAYDAALLARAVPGRPVQVVWSRQDELTWEPFGPAMVVEIGADLDAADRITAWRQDVWGNGHTSRPDGPGLPPLLGATHRAHPAEPVATQDPPMSAGGGNGRNAVPLYVLPAVRVVTHRLQTMPIRTSALRALGAHLNVYAIESVVDELAEAAGADPIEYRLGLLRDPRARAVLEAVAERSGWGDATEMSETHGRGVGLARYKNMGAYCAVVADVEAEADVRVTRLTVAVDVGLVVNPDGVANQIEGGALQSVSWTTLEAVHFDRRQVTSQTWEEYPILGFEQAPPVDLVVLNRPELPPVGSGEAAAGPTAAAIGNGLAAALGVRVRTLPLTPANIVAELG